MLSSRFQAPRRHLEVGLVVTIYVVLLVGCTSPFVISTREENIATATPHTTESLAVATEPVRAPPPTGWQSDWLQSRPCRPPCFENVTPGVTTLDQAYATWRANPQMQMVKVSSISASGHRGYIGWRWVDKSDNGGGIADYGQESVPSIISIRVTYYSHSFTVGEIISAFGEPTHVMASARRSPDSNGVSYGLTLVYLDYGFSISRSTGDRVKPTMDTQTAFDTVYYFPPSLEGFVKARDYPAEQVTSAMKVWQGMKGFAFYCIDSEGGRLCSKP
jgi:hypothetical protein